MTIPSPQVSNHEEGVLESPKVQVQPVSTEQEESQPSEALVLPSSQYPLCGEVTLPSPQMSVHTVAVELSPKVQVQSVSTAQIELQPSPFTELPSSQYPAVGLITLASPQRSVHVLAVVGFPNVQVHPASSLHVDDHPSPPLVFPSSQYPLVGVVTFPSPHVSLQALAVELSPRVHVQSDSTAQLELHPSPSAELPSSQ